jgi:hypothetical protein
MRIGSPDNRRLKDAAYAASKADLMTADVMPVVPSCSVTGTGTATVWVCPT